VIRESLGNNTARLKSYGATAPATKPGQSTEECVEHGLGWLWRSVVDQLQADRETYGLWNLVVTGGDGPLLAGLMDSATILEPDLVFLGMDVAFASPDPESVSGH